MTPEQNIKAQLVVLAEYLQTTLTDPQVKLYADELAEIGPEGLARAIVALKGDEALWPGKFPLPAKIRSYLFGDLNNQVLKGVTAILAADTAEQIHRLGRPEWEVANAYGIRAILQRDSSVTGTLFAQLREALKARYIKDQQEARIGLPKDHRHTLTQAPPLPLPGGEQGKADEQILAILEGRSGKIGRT